MEEYQLGSTDNGASLAGFLESLDRSFNDDFGYQDHFDDEAYSGEEGEGD